MYQVYELLRNLCKWLLADHAGFGGGYVRLLNVSAFIRCFVCAVDVYRLMTERVVGTHSAGTTTVAFRFFCMCCTYLCRRVHQHNLHAAWVAYLMICVRGWLGQMMRV